MGSIHTENGPVGHEVHHFVSGQIGLLVRLMELDSPNFRTGVFVTNDLSRARKANSGKFITAATSAPHKRGQLVKSLEQSALHYGVYMPDIHSDLNASAKAISAKEPGTFLPNQASLYKLESTIATLPDDDLGILAVGDLAIILLMGGSPLVDVTKPVKEVNDHIAELFMHGRHSYRFHQLQMRYDGASGWARKVKNYRGRTRDEFQKVLIDERLFIDFNDALVESLAQREVTSALHTFSRIKRVKLAKAFHGELTSIPGPLRPAVVGPDMRNAAGALQTEYVLWFLAEMFDHVKHERSDSHGKNAFYGLNITKSIKALVNNMEMVIHFPEGVPLGQSGSDVVLNMRSYEELSWRDIINGIMAHVYNFPPLSVKQAINFFETESQTSGVVRPREIPIFPPRS